MDTSISSTLSDKHKPLHTSTDVMAEEANGHVDD